MVTLVHLLGESDFGIDSTNRTTELQQKKTNALKNAVEGLRHDEIGSAERFHGIVTKGARKVSGGRDEPTPLVTALANLAAIEHTDAVHLLLIATENGPGPTSTSFPTAGPAALLVDGLAKAPNTFGRPVTASAVLARSPRLDHVRSAVANELRRKPYDDTDLVLAFGSGSSHAIVGMMLGTVEARRSFRLVPVVESAPIPAAWQPSPPSRQEIVRRLVRHRFWSAAARLDPANHDLWQLLAARQRLDRPGIDNVLTHRQDWAGYGIAGEEATLAAAFFELAGRSQATGLLLAVPWLEARYGELHRHDPVGSIDARRRNGTFGKVMGRAQKATHAGDRSAANRLLSRPEVIAINSCANSARHELLPLPADTRARIRTLVEEVSDDDPAGPLLTAAGYPQWRPMNDGSVLVLRCVGSREYPKGEHPGPSAFTDAVLSANLAAVCGTPHPDLHLRWVASLDRFPVRSDDPTVPAARISIMQARNSTKVRSASVVGIHLADGERPAALTDQGTEISGQVLAGLGYSSAGSPPTTMDAIVALTGPGTVSMNLALMLAALRISRETATPLFIGALAREPGGSTTVAEISPRQVLGLLGSDDTIRQAAQVAAEEREYALAHQLLAAGSPALADAAVTANALHTLLASHPTMPLPAPDESRIDRMGWTELWPRVKRLYADAVQPECRRHCTERPEFASATVGDSARTAAVADRLAVPLELAPTDPLGAVHLAVELTAAALDCDNKDSPEPHRPTCWRAFSATGAWAGQAKKIRDDRVHHQTALEPLDATARRIDQAHAAAFTNPVTTAKAIITGLRGELLAGRRPTTVTHDLHAELVRLLTIEIPGSHDA